MKFTKIKAQVLFCLLLMLICIEFYNHQFFQLPYGVHEWSNGERLSLAFGFFDNGMIFFLPTTFNQESIGGVVGHEFPIQSYFAAVLGHLFGRDSIPMCFRAINIVTFCLGLLSLFTIVFKKTNSFLFALITPAIMLSSPTFVDYAGGFLADPASASIIFMGFSPLVSYIETPKNKYFVWTILIMTLATLMKTSSIIYLAGALLFFGYTLLKKGEFQSIKPFLVYVSIAAISGISVLGYYLYNAYLNTHYHASLFPTKPMPFKNWDDLSQYFSQSFSHNWIDQYFILPIYLLLISLFAAAFRILRKEIEYKAYAIVSLVFSLFLLPVFWIMGHQLHVHDYYILCMVFPLIAWLSIVSVVVVFKYTSASENYKMLRRSIVASLLLLYCFADFHIYQRLNIDNPRHAPWIRVGWMKGGAKLLDNLGISKSEKILIIDEHSPNQGLLYFDRKGYVYYSDWWENCSRLNFEQFMKDKKISIAVADTKNIAKKESSDSTFFKNCDVLYKNECVTVFKFNH